MATTEGSRLRILQVLQRRHRATVDELASELELAPATIRRHLDILQRDHLILYDQVRKKTGRPEYSYFLTDQGQETLPKGYLRLLQMLLVELKALTSKELEGLSGPGLVRRLFLNLAQRQVQEHVEAVKGQDFDTRLDRAVQLLAAADFLPQVEQTDGEVLIHFLNCPFRSVALEHDQVCAFDAQLLSLLLDIPVEREGALSQGGPHCCYRVTRPAGPAGRREASPLELPSPGGAPQPEGRGPAAAPLRRR